MTNTAVHWSALIFLKKVPEEMTVLINPSFPLGLVEVWASFETILPHSYNKSRQLRNLIWPKATWASILAPWNWMFLGYQMNVKKANKGSREVLSRRQKALQKIILKQIIPTDFFVLLFRKYSKVFVNSRIIFGDINHFYLKFFLSKKHEEREDRIGSRPINLKS